MEKLIGGIQIQIDEDKGYKFTTIDEYINITGIRWNLKKEII